MGDYGHDLLFGVFIPPAAAEAAAVVATAQGAEQLGLDIVAVQDHPYHPGFLDTWTLLSYIAGRTQRLQLLPDVINLPLRPPAVLARSAAALDILSDGRVELGLGAGGQIDAIASMGGPRRSMAENVDALTEAIPLIRSLWRTGPPVTVSGTHYHLDRVRPGPPPPHAIRIWLGAYRRRMLELTGRAADAWLPSLGYVALEDLPRLNGVIDGAAEAAGRDPASIRRALNISGTVATSWEQLTELALDHGFSTFILATALDREGELRRFAEEVVPAVREAVASGRARPRPPARVQLSRPAAAPAE